MFFGKVNNLGTLNDQQIKIAQSTLEFEQKKHEQTNHRIRSTRTRVFHVFFGNVKNLGTVNDQQIQIAQCTLAFKQKSRKTQITQFVLRELVFF